MEPLAKKKMSVLKISPSFVDLIYLFDFSLSFDERISTIIGKGCSVGHSLSRICLLNLYRTLLF